MADITVRKVVLDGLNPDSPAWDACAAGGDAVLNQIGLMYIEVNNAHTSSWVVTVNSIAKCSQGYDHDAVVTVPNGEKRKIGPFNRGRFNDANGKIQITYDGVTALTIAAFEVKES